MSKRAGGRRVATAGNAADLRGVGLVRGIEEGVGEIGVVVAVRDAEGAVDGVGRAAVETKRALPGLEKLAFWTRDDGGFLFHIHDGFPVSPDGQ